ncbi:hypothetical protein D3C75_477780 [compost metagenome]
MRSLLLFTEKYLFSLRFTELQLLMLIFTSATLVLFLQIWSPNACPGNKMGTHRLVTP